MNQRFLKITLVVFPIITMYLSGFVLAFVQSFIFKALMIEFHPVGFALPFGNYVILGICIYYSCKLWKKYIE